MLPSPVQNYFSAVPINKSHFPAYGKANPSSDFIPSGLCNNYCTQLKYQNKTINSSLNDSDCHAGKSKRVTLL